MLLRYRKLFSLFSVPTVSPLGGETRVPLGEIRASVSSRSARETIEDDLYRATETVSVLIPAKYTPEGGFLRGMMLQCGTVCYRMLTPVDLGRMWAVKCVRIHV